MRVDVLQSFEKEASKRLSTKQREELERVFDRAVTRPDLGDSLGPDWLREVRIQGKRIYFLRGPNRVLFVGISGKKNQQAVIDLIRSMLPEYKKLI